jgi:beta propeller repeat protein
MKSKIIFMAVALICLIGSISVASSSKVTKISWGHNPAIYDSKVVWSDDTFDNNGIIHVYNLTTKEDVEINASNASYPAIYDNKMVWHDESSGTSRLAVYDIPSGAMSYITKNVDNSSIPSIYSDIIVWSANGSIYMRNISAHAQNMVAVGVDPDIYNNTIVYCYPGNDTPQIYMYDIATEKAIDISGYGYNSKPHIYGNKVVWSDLNTRLGNIRMYDIDTEQQTEVTTGDDFNGYNTGGPNDIYGDKVVYVKHRYTDADNVTDPSDYGDLCVYDIPTGQETTLASDYIGNIALYGSTVVWDTAMGWKADGDISIYDFSANVTEPTATFTANVVSGKAPLSVQFTSITTGNPTDYYWVFEPSTSCDWNSHHAVTAVHTFRKPGKYTVSLNVTNSAGSYTVKKTDYITVK